MNPQQAMQMLAQFGISEQDLPMIAQAVNALTTAGVIPDENEAMHGEEAEEAQPAQPDPYKAQIAQQLARGR